MPLIDQIEARLQAAFAPLSLSVHDDSAQHADHHEAYPQGESHFRVHIVAQAFAGQARLARHRAVYTALGQDMMRAIHALVIRAYTPEEANKN